MGDYMHHAIIVIGSDWRKSQLIAAREYAIAAGNHSVTEIIPSRTNGFSSFMVAPDGSKEGWANSNEGDDARDKLVAYLNDYENNGLLEWAEVYFGWEGGTTISRSSNPPEDWR